MAVIFAPEQQSIAGRIGKGLGQGLADQIPKEVERHRLSKGLQQFEKESANLTPIQQLTRLSAIPGITPQMIQSFGELGKQQAKGQALKDLNKTSETKPPEKTTRFPGTENKNNESKIPSLTTPEPIAETLEPYIQKSYDEIIKEAGERFNERPELFNNDPQKAIEAAFASDERNQAISEQIQGKRTKQEDVQSKVKGDLRHQYELLTGQNTKVPEDIYSNIEDEAKAAVQPKNKGGRGLTEEQASKEYGEKLRQIDKQYHSLYEITPGTMMQHLGSTNRETIQKKRLPFKERGDLEHFAETLISNGGMSPMKAYHQAYPVSDIKELNNTIAKLPKHGIIPATSEESLNAAKNIFKVLGDGSPLAVAQELYGRGYDPEVWFDYLQKNSKKLNGRQVDELGKDRSNIPTPSDVFIWSIMGLDDLTEL